MTESIIHQKIVLLKYKIAPLILQNCKTHPTEVGERRTGLCQSHIFQFIYFLNIGLYSLIYIKNNGRKELICMYYMSPSSTLLHVMGDLLHSS